MSTTQLAFMKCFGAEAKFDWLKNKLVKPVSYNRNNQGWIYWGGGVWGGVHPPQPWLGGCRGGAIFLNKEEKNYI